MHAVYLKYRQLDKLKYIGFKRTYELSTQPRYQYRSTAIDPSRCNPLSVTLLSTSLSRQQVHQREPQQEEGSAHAQPAAARPAGPARDGGEEAQEQAQEQGEVGGEAAEGGQGARAGRRQAAQGQEREAARSIGELAQGQALRDLGGVLGERVVAFPLRYAATAATTQQEEVSLPKDFHPQGLAPSKASERRVSTCGFAVCQVTQRPISFVFFSLLLAAGLRLPLGVSEAPAVPPATALPPPTRAPPPATPPRLPRAAAARPPPLATAASVWDRPPRRPAPGAHARRPPPTIRPRPTAALTAPAPPAAAPEAARGAAASAREVRPSRSGGTSAETVPLPYFYLFDRN